MVKSVKTITVPLRRNMRGGRSNYGAVVHTATIRSDWTAADWQTLAEMFPNTAIITPTLKLPVGYLATDSHQQRALFRRGRVFA